MRSVSRSCPESDVRPKDSSVSCSPSDDMESSTPCSIMDGMIERGGVPETHARVEPLLIAGGDSVKIAPCTKLSIDSMSL